MCLQMPTIYFNVDDKDGDDDHHKDDEQYEYEYDNDDDHKGNDDKGKLLMMIILQCYLTLALVQTIDSTIPIQH